MTPVVPTTVEALRLALASTIACSAQELQDAVGQVVVATAAELPASASVGAEKRSVHDAASRTLVLLADRIPVGQEAQSLAAEIARHLGRKVVQRVFGEGAAELLAAEQDGEKLAHGLHDWMGGLQVDAVVGLLRPDGTLRGLTFGRPQGKRGPCIQISLPKHDLNKSMGLEGRDFHELYAEAVALVAVAKDISVESQEYRAMLGTGASFLKANGLELKSVSYTQAVVADRVKSFDAAGGQLSVVGAEQRKTAARNARYTVHGADVTDGSGGFAYCLDGTYSPDFLTEQDAWDAAHADFAANLVIDGLDQQANFAGDGQHPPFVVFDVSRQENIAGPFASRDLAEQHRQEILAGEQPRLDAKTLGEALTAIDEAGGLNGQSVKSEKAPSVADIEALALRCMEDQGKSDTRFMSLVGMSPERFADEVERGHSRVCEERLAVRFSGPVGVAMREELSSWLAVSTEQANVVELREGSVVRTSELKGLEFDWAVAVASGRIVSGEFVYRDFHGTGLHEYSIKAPSSFTPSRTKSTLERVEEKAGVPVQVLLADKFGDTVEVPRWVVNLQAKQVAIDERRELLVCQARELGVPAYTLLQAQLSAGAVSLQPVDARKDESPALGM